MVAVSSTCCKGIVTRYLDQMAGIVERDDPNVSRPPPLKSLDAAL